jgi:hypothetical protein
MKLPLITLLLFSATRAAAADPLGELRLGRANHAFDHVGAIGDQAEAAAASGATIIYPSGFGTYGYQGLPPASEVYVLQKRFSNYNRRAKEKGIELVIGYLCATSIVKLDAFDANWSPEFRAQFATPPSQWLQQGRHGPPLPSWYGGDYRPACMNNPDWQAYETFMVRQQLASGHDGIFFDNPTVHPQGCYCPHCMKKFAAYLDKNGIVAKPTSNDSRCTEEIRLLADAHPTEFLRFRSTIAAGFLSKMRSYARTQNPNALITCNNSLNAPSVLYSQCRSYGYNINELSKAEDFIVVEDMGSQPRVEADGRAVEYGPTYNLLHAVSHGKPIVAVTLVGDDYHTAPNLVRLAMAEAAAHSASYLSWPTWPEEQRQRMIAAVRPQADLLREHEAMLNDARPRAEVTLFLPFRQWVDTDNCKAASLAAALSQANVQYNVISDDNFELPERGKHSAVFLAESHAAFTPQEAAAVTEFQDHGGQVVTADDPQWFDKLRKAIGTPSLTVKGPPTVRAVLHDQPNRAIIHLYNLNVQRLSSFDDKLTPAKNIKLTAALPFSKVHSVAALTADKYASAGPLEFHPATQDATTLVEIAVPRLDVSSLIVIDAEP